MYITTCSGSVRQFHNVVIQFQVLAEHQPYLSRADRNGNQEVGRLFVRLLGAQLGGSEAVASIQRFLPASSILHFYDHRGYVILYFHPTYEFIQDFKNCINNVGCI